MSFSVLIVEDEYLIALNNRLAVEEMGLVVAGIASSGSEAIAMAAEMHPSLILMDVILGGGIDGIEAAEAIYERFKIPSIFISGNLEGDNMRRIERLHHYGCLGKPCEDEDLKYLISYARNSLSGAEN